MSRDHSGLPATRGSEHSPGNWATAKLSQRHQGLHAIQRGTSGSRDDTGTVMRRTWAAGSRFPRARQMQVPSYGDAGISQSSAGKEHSDQLPVLPGGGVSRNAGESLGPMRQDKGTKGLGAGRRMLAGPTGWQTRPPCGKAQRPARCHILPKHLLTAACQGTWPREAPNDLIFLQGFSSSEGKEEAWPSDCPHALLRAPQGQQPGCALLISAALEKAA